jgi:benzoyl-CoA reductase/2-hydroxyglutaryl-CoA dehydratase subunit BcrC/BadD/HgdB
MGELAFKVHPMEVPSAKNTEEADFYWQNSVKKLARALEAVTGNRITRRRLQAAVRKMQLASFEFRRLTGFQQNIPPLIYGKDLFLVMNAFLYDDLDRWTAAVTRLNEALELRKKQGAFVARNAPRILLTGSPPAPPGLKIPLLIEETGAIVVTDEVCSCSRLLYDTVVSGEPRLYDLMAAVADRYLKPSTCPFFDSSQDRRRKVLELARRFRVDGVIYPVYSGCQLYQMEQRDVGNVFRQAAVPILFIESDYSPEDGGQVGTRIEAFVESVQSRKTRS